MSAAELTAAIAQLPPEQLEQVRGFVQQLGEATGMRPAPAREEESDQRRNTIRELQAIFKRSPRTLEDFLREKHAAGENW